MKCLFQNWCKTLEITITRLVKHLYFLFIIEEDNWDLRKFSNRNTKETRHRKNSKICFIHLRTFVSSIKICNDSNNRLVTFWIEVHFMNFVFSPIFFLIWNSKFSLHNYVLHNLPNSNMHNNQKSISNLWVRKQLVWHLKECLASMIGFAGKWNTYPCYRHSWSRST